ncbi:hypothetical protein ACIRNI_22745 [Streptomyces sp. NPDC093546]|uniref:hypothetical protein n=1 Tax=Streptomyces sp. NPDC093546 TaxID=3366040 RepID=UPI00381A089E
MASAGLLAFAASSSAHAAGVDASARDARFTGSYYVGSTGVKINGSLTDLGSYSGSSAVYLKINTTEGSTNSRVVEAANGTKKWIPGTLTYPFPGTFLSGSITACSWAGSWSCGTPIAIYR